MGAPPGPETERVRRIWDKVAPRYDDGITFVERMLFSGDREWVCSKAVGDVLEVGVGTGRNLPYYPRGVRLTGIELSGEMLEIARRRAQELAWDVDLRLGNAQALDFPDDSFDGVVCTLTLCSVPDDRMVIREIKRVLRPGGRFIAFEHVASPKPAIRIIQRALNPITVRFQADYLTREPVTHLRAEGFLLEQLERRKLGIVERILARKPEASGYPQA